MRALQLREVNKWHSRDHCPGLAGPEALTIQRGSNMPTVVLTLNVKESKQGPKKEEQRRLGKNENKGGEENDLRIQKDLRGWLSEERASKSKQ